MSKTIKLLSVIIIMIASSFSLFAQTPTPPLYWDLNGGPSDPYLQGFATQMSVNLGDTVQFKIQTDSSAYQLDIYRMGYYGGDGAGYITTVLPSVLLPQSQPPCLTDSSTGLID